MGPYGPQPGPGPNRDWAPTRARDLHLLLKSHVKKGRHIFRKIETYFSNKYLSSCFNQKCNVSGPDGSAWQDNDWFLKISEDLGSVYTFPTSSEPKTQNSDQHFLRG